MNANVFGATSQTIDPAWFFLGAIVLFLVVSRARRPAPSPGYHPTTLANIEALFDPGESTSSLSEWQVVTPASGALWYPERGVFGTNPGSKLSPARLESATLALTSNSVYFVQFSGARGRSRGGFGAGPLPVKSYKAMPIANVRSWSFESLKTTRGVLTGYRFAFETGMPGWSGAESIWWAAPAVAEPFIQQFKALTGRYSSSTAQIDIAGQLRALQALLTDGVISEEEMRRAKDMFLGRAPDQRQAMERNLRSLFELHRAGVLNQVEFEIKKRDILATTQ